MNLRNGLVAFGIAASVLGSWVRAQEPPKPTDEAKILAADEGTWDATIKTFRGGPRGKSVSVLFFCSARFLRSRGPEP